MASARAPSSTYVASHTIRMDPTGLLDVLPPELITDILEYLPIDVLWTAARVSRELYAAAWRAGLFIHRNMSWMPVSDFDAALAAFKDVLDHVKRKDLRLSLTLRIDPPGADSSLAQHAADELFPLISAALPFLVHLSIRIPNGFRRQLDSALRFPAQRLLTLELDRTKYDSHCAVLLPRDLFRGSAPQLHTVKLGAVPLPVSPIFRAVSHASIRHRKSFPHIDIGHHLPSLANLHLTFIDGDDVVYIYDSDDDDDDNDNDHGPAVPLPACFDFQTMGLRALVIEDISRYGNTPLLDVIKRCIDLSTIPVVEVSGRKIRWDERLWAEDTAALSIRVTVSQKDIRALRVIAVPAHLRWRRVYNLFPHERELLPIGGLPGLSARLEYLRLEQMLIGNWLALNMPFPALRALRIDMQALFRGHVPLAPGDLGWFPHPFFRAREPALPDTVSHVSTPCPALELITLFALDLPTAGIDSRRVALLAQGLGQAQRPKEERAAITLVGYEFDEPVEHALLDQSVSEIRTHAFAGVGSREDYDGGLWERVL